MKEGFKFQKSEIRKDKLTVEGQEILCNFGKNNFDHSYHSTDRQLNSIVDLIINISLEQQRQKEIIREQIIKLQEKVDYIKESLVILERKTIKEPVGIDQIIKKLENLSLDKGKNNIERKPAIWKYY